MAATKHNQNSLWLQFFNSFADPLGFAIDWGTVVHSQNTESHETIIFNFELFTPHQEDLVFKSLFTHTAIKG